MAAYHSFLNMHFHGVLILDICKGSFKLPLHIIYDSVLNVRDFNRHGVRHYNGNTIGVTIMTKINEVTANGQPNLKKSLKP